MPQIKLHQDCFDVQMGISSEAPTNVYDLADRLLELIRALVGMAAKARLAIRLRRELGQRGESGHRFDETCEARCPRCGSRAVYRKGSRSKTVGAQRLGPVEVERPYLEYRKWGRSYTPYTVLPARRVFPSDAAMGKRRYGQTAAASIGGNDRNQLPARGGGLSGVSFGVPFCSHPLVNRSGGSPRNGSLA